MVREWAKAVATLAVLSFVVGLVVATAAYVAGVLLDRRSA